MSQNGERNLALFIDFDNVALGARDSRMRFDVRLLMQRVLEKGKVVVKRAYADWHFYKEHMTPLHEAAIELIEVPSPRISGKNSADIRLVVDAIDLCYAKSHIDTFVIVSGDSDFSPLVSKLRENNKGVIGIGVRSSSSHLLIANCDEFVFYDDIYHSAVTKLTEKVSSVPQDKRELFDFLLATTKSLLQESRGVLYSSLIKDTMKRKQPEFAEGNYGYATFGDLLEDARDSGLLEVQRDSRAGGTLVVLGLGKGEAAAENRPAKSRRRRRDRGRKSEREGREATATDTTTETTAAPAEATAAAEKASPPRSSRKKAKVTPAEKPPAKKAPARKTARKSPAKAAAPTAEKVPAKKASTKKAATTKTARKAAEPRAAAKKTAKKAGNRTPKKAGKKAGGK